jgi:hypothetical protein
MTIANFGGERDVELEAVARELLDRDPTGELYGSVYRETFDQLYDGQRTGRYRWEDLFKTEKTHYGTLIEINLQRKFEFDDGDVLDYKIAGIEVDCKYSFRDGGWMLPPESWDQLVMVSSANDQLATWSLGVVRTSETNRRVSVNRDGKSTLSPQGRLAIRWLFRDVGFPPNVLLQLDPAEVAEIFAAKRGQSRVDALFRVAQGRRIHRNAVATVAQQQDYMKRVRANGGSRSNLRDEGILILGGDYGVHRDLAASFGVPVPMPGELVSFRVVPASESDVLKVELDGGFWRKASQHDLVNHPAPLLPKLIT